MNIKSKILVGTLLVSSFSTTVFAANPAALQCLQGQSAMRHSNLSQPEMFNSCLKKRPVYYIKSWYNNGKKITKKGKLTPMAYTNTDIKMCGNPCK